MSKTATQRCDFCQCEMVAGEAVRLRRQYHGGVETFSGHAVCVRAVVASLEPAGRDWLCEKIAPGDIVDAVELVLPREMNLLLGDCTPQEQLHRYEKRKVPAAAVVLAVMIAAMVSLAALVGLLMAH